MPGDEQRKHTCYITQILLSQFYSHIRHRTADPNEYMTSLSVPAINSRMGRIPFLYGCKINHVHLTHWCKNNRD